MKEKRQVVSMLFADIKGFSGIKSDPLYSTLGNIIDQIKTNLQSQQNNFFINTWGDAFFICSYDPFDLVDIALDLRDKFRNENWFKLGFKEKLSIRIGIHTESANIRFEDGEVTNVIGTSVNNAARIEPMVNPNEIWVSSIFQQLANDGNQNFKYIDLGVRDLAKEYGNMHLYQVLREYEQTSSDTYIKKKDKGLDIPMPRIKKEITDKDKRDFVKKSLSVISEYFKQALVEIKKHGEKIESEYTGKGQYDFEADIYINGDNKAHCRISLDQDYGGSAESIKFAHGQHISEGSANEIIYVEDDGYDLFLKPMGMAMMHQAPDQTKDAKEIAKYLWVVYTQALSH